MKKLILLFITLTTFMNLSYASFPITYTLEIKQDTVYTETVAEYHLRMQKMGFDIEDCRCDDCKKFKGINNAMKNGETKQKQKTNYKSIFVTMGVWLIVMIILLLVWIVRGLMNWDPGSDLFA
jgi:uncharacterized membrane protein